MRYIYLHGFASSRHSRKAQAFRSALSELGLVLEIPELEEGDFEHLTISRQLSTVERVVAGDPCRLVGSSMGGYLGGLYAAAHANVERLVLLAPAFGFSERWQSLAGPEKLLTWKESGGTEVFHYGENALRRIGYGLYEDSLRHAAMPGFAQSARIFHGVHDEVVPITLSRQFVASHPNAGLEEFDSGHELLNVLESIVSSAVPFLTS